jgi:hypothetical protein
MVDKSVNIGTEVRFYFGKHEEIFALHELGICEDDLEDWEDEDLADYLHEEQAGWAENYTDTGWEFK